MIKASELRVDNIVWESSSFTPSPEDYEEIVVGAINDIDKVVLDSQNNIYSYDYLYPIPLTPKWLERCGFVKKGISWRIDINSSDELCFYHPENVLRYQTQGDGFTRGFRHIKYLHQLQNLYFALTGEELTIKN